MQGSLIFRPNAIDMETIKNPEEYGLGLTSEIIVTTGDDEKLFLWVSQPKNQDKNMYVFFHGNTGHLGDVGGPSKKDEEPYYRDYRIRFLKQIKKRCFIILKALVFEFHC